MVANVIIIPRGRRLTIDGEVNVRGFASATLVRWVLVVLGELKITRLAKVIFAEGKVVIASDGTLILDGAATFEALTLGREYPSNDAIMEPSKRTCVTGSGRFVTQLLSQAGYEAATFEILCELSPNISFFWQQEGSNLIPSRFELGSNLPYMSTELTLIVGLQSFTANFETTKFRTFGFAVKIQNLNAEKVLDLQIKNLIATNLNLVGSIRISRADCYANRLQISGSGTGVVLMQGGETMNFACKIEFARKFFDRSCKLHNDPVEQSFKR